MQQGLGLCQSTLPPFPQILEPGERLGDVLGAQGLQAIANSKRRAGKILVTVWVASCGAQPLRVWVCKTGNTVEAIFQHFLPEIA